MKLNVCIFGSNSILAENFIKNYSEKYRIIGISRTKQINKNKDITAINYDLSESFSKINLASLIEKIEDITKKESKVFILFSWAGKARDADKNIIKANLEANQNIIKNFIYISNKCNPKKLIFISSAGAIYSQISERLSKETDKPIPSSEYGLQKLLGENALRKKLINKRYLTILRVSSAYGFNPRCPDQGVINKWLFNINRKEPIQLYNSIDSRINFISFDNISIAIHEVIQNALCGLFNIGSNESTSLRKLIFIMNKISDPQPIRVIEKDKNLRLFNLDTNSFYRKTCIRFNSNIYKDSEKIFSLIKNL